MGVGVHIFADIENLERGRVSRSGAQWAAIGPQRVHVVLEPMLAGLDRSQNRRTRSSVVARLHLLRRSEK
jgi:hypothetical protein